MSVEALSAKHFNPAFPLLGIKNVGVQAVKEIVEEREKRGLYKDLSDFKRRTNIPRTITATLCC